MDVDYGLGHGQRPRRDGAILYRRGSPSTLDEVSVKPSFFLTVPARKPRTLCCCQLVASMSSGMVVPSARFSSCRSTACFVMRAPTGCCAGGALRLPRAVVFAARSRVDAALFPGARREVADRLVSADLLVELVGMASAPWLSERRHWRSHHPKPRVPRGEPRVVGLGSYAPTDTRTNAWFGGEVQSVSGFSANRRGRG
jgi:hypothetical protein